MMLNNPILRREFMSALRSRKTALFAGLLVFSLSAILLLFWPRSGVFSQTDTHEMFTVFLGAFLTIALLVTPGFTATAITDERENRSFDLLFTTLLTPGEILIGKLLSSLGLTVLLLLLAMPVSAVCALSGGISIGLLLKAYGVILAAVLTVGLFGLTVSAMCRRSLTSLLVTYIGILLLCGATWLPAALLSQYELLVPYLRAIRCFSPFDALFALNYGGAYELAVGGFQAQNAFQFYLWGMGTLSAIFLAIFCFFVLRPARSRGGRWQPQYADRRTAIRRKLMFPFYLIDPLKRRKPISRLQNPVFVAELRSKIFGHPKFVLRALFACIVLSLLILTLVAQQLGTTLQAEQVRLVAVLFQVGVVALLAPAVSSGSITDERTSGTLLLLRMTPLSAARVVAGKLKAAFVYVLIFLLSGLPVLLALRYLESENSYWRLAAWIAILLLTAVVFTSAGLCASSLLRTTAAATAASYGFTAFICLGTLSVLLLGARVHVQVKAALLALNPLVAALQVTSDTWFTDMPRLFGNQLWQNNLILLGGLAVALLGVSAYRVHRLFTEQS